MFFISCVGAVFFGSLAAAPIASAVITNHSGTICKNYNNDEVSFVDYFTYGTRSLKTSPQQILCPLTRNTSTSTGAWVYVDIKHTSFATTTCVAYSYNENGVLLDSHTLSWTGTGVHEFELNLTGKGMSNAWSDYSVLCTIPGNGVATIMGIDVSE